MEATNAFLLGASLPMAIASTYLVLIPKIPNPTTFADFRPINLCTFVNKVISKLIANRMAGFLPSIISKEQSGFVREREIVDNIMLAQELVASMGLPNRGRNMEIKLDMEKAYDRLDWQLLIGFAESWINILFKSLSQSWFSPIINGAAVGFIKSFRGVRRGDPLSPTLFIIATEILSRNLNKMGHRPSFSRFHTTSGCPLITHISYADDVLIFSSGDMHRVRQICQMLRRYEASSGNKAKCSIAAVDLPFAVEENKAAINGFHIMAPLHVSWMSDGMWKEECCSLRLSHLQDKGENIMMAQQDSFHGR
ncbi:uncharacterized protein M6B38_367850 [Iris pallida]|uniref:Reverse transcriptase domain-containing protein n=1 Tax=Iris pallida TaxID=29817 RepID=A0AAX6GF78_IRIPA|nr:uncharacterized protein M6B38_367850 [Iris pallida]